jgi:hypothetical protein
MGEYVDNMKGWKRGTRFAKLGNMSIMSEEEIDAHAMRTWELLTQDSKNSEGQSVRASTNEKSYQTYQVTLKGSSLLGESNGLENFKITYEKLSELRDKGRAKCYTRWCKACTLYRLQLQNDVTGHVLKISFPNVISLASIINIDWSWENPDSEWAKKKGDPSMAYKSLVENKSKPVFYVRLVSEDYMNMLLGGQR